jgi:hypothetical protein
MKKILLLVCLMFVAGIAAFAQTISYPAVEKAENGSCSINKIETTDKYTIVTFEYTAPSDDAWADIRKEVFIKTDVSDKHYNFVKAENISISPEKTYFTHADEKLAFKVYFQKIPKNAKSVDVIENADNSTDTSNYFNYYNVSLTKSQGKVVTKMTIMPPPPRTGTNELGNIFNSMGPMFSNMAKSMMDAQLEYYKQPGKIAEIAKLNREYYNALVKEGFTYDQALKIITSESLLPKATMSGK